MPAPAASGRVNLLDESPAVVPPRVVVAGYWRVAVFLGVALLACVGLQLATVFLFRLGRGGAPSLAWSVATLAVGLLVAHAVVLRRYHDGHWDFVGLQRAGLTPSALLRAGLLGVLTIGLPSVLLLSAGELRVEAGDATGLAPWKSALPLLAVLVPAALWEELALRGYLFAVLRERFDARGALVVTSAIFGALHLPNAGATALSTAAVALAGVFLGLVRLSTGSLYAAWAAHLAWNLTLSFALRTPVSGIDLTMRGYHVVDAGPDWLTGGAWGPEGGVAAMLGMIVASWYMVRRMRREESET